VRGRREGREAPGELAAIDDKTPLKLVGDLGQFPDDRREDRRQPHRGLRNTAYPDFPPQREPEETRELPHRHRLSRRDMPHLARRVRSGAQQDQGPADVRQVAVAVRDIQGERHPHGPARQRGDEEPRPGHRRVGTPRAVVVADPGDHHRRLPAAVRRQQLLREHRPGPALAAGRSQRQVLTQRPGDHSVAVQVVRVDQPGAGDGHGGQDGPVQPRELRWPVRVPGLGTVVDDIGAPHRLGRPVLGADVDGHPADPGARFVTRWPTGHRPDAAGLPRNQRVNHRAADAATGPQHDVRLHTHVRLHTPVTSHPCRSEPKSVSITHLSEGSSYLSYSQYISQK
jgi:hypothetical protein